MAYIENPFKEGQFVVCINDTFPVVETTMTDKSVIGTIPKKRPKKDEVCCIDEILGEFIRFDEYDDNDPSSIDYGYKWWKHTHFKHITHEELENHYESVAKYSKKWVDKNLLNIDLQAEL